MGSRSARQLARSIGAIQVYANKHYKPRRSDILIRWGNPQPPTWAESIPDIVLNGSKLTATASNKLRAYKVLEIQNISVPRHTELRSVAQSWNTDVFVRHELYGHGGAGIEIVARGRRLPHAPLYTEAIENHGEYRVHVFDGEVIDYCKKRRLRDVPPANDTEARIRSYDNGWIFSRLNLKRLKRIKELAISSVEALGLTFGGVDIVRDQNGKVFTIEINTACGMSPTTELAYTRAIEKYASN